MTITLIITILTLIITQITTTTTLIITIISLITSVSTITHIITITPITQIERERERDASLRYANSWISGDMISMMMMMMLLMMMIVCYVAFEIRACMFKLHGTCSYHIAVALSQVCHAATKCILYYTIILLLTHQRFRRVRAFGMQSLIQE